MVSIETKVKDHGSQHGSQAMEVAFKGRASLGFGAFADLVMSCITKVILLKGRVLHSEK